MHIFKTKTDLEAFLQPLKSSKKTVGMVPTMGALHEGHLTLVKKALAENSWVVVSIFVNPTQFNNSEDLLKYPKTLNSDVELLRELGENIVVFSPGVYEMYHTDVTPKNYDFNGLDSVMEGAFRANHFNGVGTIVEALLTLVLPQKAYFGEKDFQQLQIIKHLVKQQEIPVEIIGCAIVREENGLAMSSRNNRLPLKTRKLAGFILENLKKAKNYFKTHTAAETEAWMVAKFNTHPLFELEYFTIADAETLRPVKDKSEHNSFRGFIAVYANDVRLIDTIKF